MPLMRCTDPECQHEFFHRAPSLESADCEECGEPAEPVDTYHERDDVLERSNRDTVPRRPRQVYARAAARALLEAHEVSKPPIPVRKVAHEEGFRVEEHPSLGRLRARMRGKLIEVAAGDAEVVKRFSIAHELGHHVLESAHGDGREAEIEANAFAGELLVPGPMLLAAVDETTSLRVLASRFQVSLTALRKAAETHGKSSLLN